MPGGPRSLRHTAPDQTRLMRDPPPPPPPSPFPPLPCRPPPSFGSSIRLRLHAGRVTGVGRACCRSGFCPRRHRNRGRPAVSPPATRSSAVPPGLRGDRWSAGLSCRVLASAGFSALGWRSGRIWRPVARTGCPESGLVREEILSSAPFGLADLGHLASFIMNGPLCNTFAANQE